MKQKNKKEIICGIYLIHNAVENKSYVGSAKDIYKRHEQHKRSANKKRGCRLLADAYNRLPNDSFSYSILEHCEEYLLEEKETYWILKYDSRNIEKGYNIALPGRKIFEKSRENINKFNINTKVPIYSLDENNNLLEYESIQLASEDTDVEYTKIINILAYWSKVKGFKQESKSKFKSAKGYIFIRKEEYDLKFDYLNHKIIRSNSERAMKRRGEIPKEIRMRKIQVTPLVTNEPVIYECIEACIRDLKLNRNKVFQALKNNLLYKDYIFARV